MPLIQCPKCAQEYDLPGVVAVRMTGAIAICHCGEWLSGSKAAVLARTLGSDQIREVDLQPYRVTPEAHAPATPRTAEESSSEPREQDSAPQPTQTLTAAPSRAVLVCTDGPLSGQEFEIPPTGLVVGREGHVRVADEFLSRRHFELLRDVDGSIRVRDLGSRNGTFLNTVPARDTLVRAGDEIRAGENAFRIEQRD